MKRLRISLVLVILVVFSIGLATAEPTLDENWLSEQDQRIVAEGVPRSSGFLSEDHDLTVAAAVPFKPDEVIVRFGSKVKEQFDTAGASAITPASVAEQNQILSVVGNASVKRSFTIVPGLSVVKLPAGTAVEDAVAALNTTDGVLYAEPNYIFKALSTFPNDSRFDEL